MATIGPRHLLFHAPPLFLFCADLPGAFGSVVALIYYSRIEDNGTALRRNVGTMVASMTLALGTTVLFQAFGLNGAVWQMCMGAGLYVTYSIMGSPVFERIFAFGRVEGSISFLIFGSDLCGYIATLQH